LGVLLLNENQFTGFIPFKHSHDIVDIKPFSLIIVQLGHGSSKLSELSVIESLNSIRVDQATLAVHQEALHGHLAAELIQEATSFECFLEGVGIIFICEDKCSLQIERIEIEFFNVEGSWQVAAFIHGLGFKHLLFFGVMHDVACGVDEVAFGIDRLTLKIVLCFFGLLLVEFNDQVSLVVSFYFTDNVYLVEITEVSRGT